MMLIPRGVLHGPIHHKVQPVYTYAQEVLIQLVCPWLLHYSQSSASMDAETFFLSSQEMLCDSAAVIVNGVKSLS
jgi:hypothetical protein